MRQRIASCSAAQLKIAIGELFPQTQQANGEILRETLSKKVANSLSGLGRRSFPIYAYGFNMSWEIDFWGHLRRGIEAASDNLDASVHDYDDVLVTLLSDVATNYVNLRTTEKRIRYSQENVVLQEEVARQVKARTDVGAVTEVGYYQAIGLQWQTDAQINEFEIALRQYNNQLCILLGIPPEELRNKLGYMPGTKRLNAKVSVLPKEAKKNGEKPAETGPNDTEQTIRIPKAPDPQNVAVGIPANLLRRRPDIRRAESLAASQCAQIGIAEADFYPYIYILGTVGTSAAQFKDLFRPQAFNGTIGPTFQWNILNYGRILNNVRNQDAKFLELVTAYQQAVLNGQLEVENGLVMYLQARERFRKQANSVDAAEKAQKLVVEQFKAGTVNIAQLILFQQNLVLQQDTLAVAEGEIAMGLIQVYKGLGGGWEIRMNGCDPHAVALQPAADCPIPPHGLSASGRGRAHPARPATLEPMTNSGNCFAFLKRPSRGA